MDGFITALETPITSTALWAELTPAAAIVGVLVIFSFGYYVLRKVVKGAGKGKAKI